MSDIAIQVEHLSKRYRIGVQEEKTPATLGGKIIDVIWRPLKNLQQLRKLSQFEDKDNNFDEAEDVFWALKDVSFKVKQGEIVGIIGRNGSGKSTLLKILSRITEPTSGRAIIRGKVSSLLEVGTGFNPDLTGRENIYMNGIILGMQKSEIDRKFDEIVDFSGVEKFIDTPVKRYSSGMNVRLGFAVAAYLEPEILLVDEVLSVGDLLFQQKCMHKIENLMKGGHTVFLVSHNMHSILSLCQRAILIDNGVIISDGNSNEVVQYYRTLMKDNIITSETEPGLWSIQAPENKYREVSVNSIEMLEPTTGKRKAYLSTGESVTFRLHFHSNIAFNGAGFIFSIYYAGNERALISARTEIDLFKISLHAGQTDYLDCTFPIFPLAANHSDKYVLGIAIYNPLTNISFFENFNFGELTVLPKDVRGKRYPISTNTCYLAIDYYWKTNDANQL